VGGRRNRSALRGSRCKDSAGPLPGRCLLGNADKGREDYCRERHEPSDRGVLT
jgi:hypothetical protein